MQPNIETFIIFKPMWFFCLQAVVGHFSIQQILGSPLLRSPISPDPRGRDGNGAVSNYDFHMRSDGTSRVIFSAPLPLIFQVLISARRLQMMSSVCHAKTRSAGWTLGLGHSAPARCSGTALNRPPQLSACSCGIKVKGNNEETSPLSGNS